MSLNISNKKQKIVSLIKKYAKNAFSIIIIEFNKAKSNQMNALRRLCRERDINLMIARNKLIQLAIRNTKMESLKKCFVGQNIIAFSSSDIQEDAKFFKKFFIKNDEFLITFGMYEGKILLKQDIELLVSLPNRKEAITQLILIIKEISIVRFIRILFLIKNKNT